ncbi:MAG: flagellin, partial [Burkholderiales bacterium]
NPVEIKSFIDITKGGTGDVLDKAAGLILTNGGKTVTLDTSSAESVEDLLNLINGLDLGLAAEINAARDGINLRSRLSGTDLTIGENGGQLATQLGIRTYTGESKLADFNRGIGVPTATDPTKNDLLITARDGTQLSINLSTAKTVQDVISLINGNAANNTGSTAVIAQLAATGNGIELVDQSTTTTGSFSVQMVEGSQAAQYLGFVPDGQTQTSTSTLDADGNYVIQSEDRHTIESDSVFNTLIRLKQALEQNDTGEISRSIDRLDTDISRVTFARGEIGSRMQSLEVIGDNLKDENVQLKSALSDDIDVDLVEAISNMTARQYSLQASLQTAASLMQLSLLNFI